MKVRFVINPKRVAKLAETKKLKFRVGDSEFEIALDGVDLVPIPKGLMDELDQVVAKILSDQNKQVN